MTRRAIIAALLAPAAVGVALLVRPRRARAQQPGQVREFDVRARDYAFTPARLEVEQDDIVRVRFTAEDIAHSFTIDAYRIAKRAGAGQSVRFEFRADQPGTFTFYCSLLADDRCRNMRGELVVRPR